MNFNLTVEQEMIQKTAKEFAEKTIMPIAKKIDEDNFAPQDLYEQMANLGFFGIPYKEEYGGLGLDYNSCVLAVEQIARVSSGVALSLSVHYLGLSAINLFGTEEQKIKFMTNACLGKEIASFAFTEPDTGSDPKQIKTIATKKGDYYILNGIKRFISSADLKGPMVVFANEESSGKNTAFVIHKMCQGYTLSSMWDKIGLKGNRSYDVYLDGVKVHAKDMIGNIGQGYLILQAAIALGKLTMSSLFLGLAQGALEESKSFVTTRNHRDGTISKFMNIKMKLADIAIKVEAARWLVYRLGFLVDEMKDYTRIAQESALTKTFVTETAQEVARLAVSVHGSYGVMKDYKVERIYRDSIIGGIIELENDVQRLIVSSKYC
jgi:alkylation response protein AidB-like acyl-CoA dehydrogenase